MKIYYSKKFIKQFKKSPKQIKIKFKERLDLFIEDRYNPTLSNHRLSGNFINYRSINVTGDWRAIFKELENGEVIFFVILGTHSELYKN
jgi:addiction module RelE/StbE family toxin